MSFLSRRVRSEEAEFTLRSSAISGAVTGWRYAMIESTSRLAIESLFFPSSPSRLRTGMSYSLRETRRGAPPARGDPPPPPQAGGGCEGAVVPRGGRRGARPPRRGGRPRPVRRPHTPARAPRARTRPLPSKSRRPRRGARPSRACPTRRGAPRGARRASSPVCLLVPLERRFLARRVEVDLAEFALLPGPDAPEPEKLEDGEKDRDGLGAARKRAEHVRQRHGAAPGLHAREHLLHFLPDRELLVFDLHRRRVLRAVAVERALEERQQVEERDFRKVGLFGLPFRRLELRRRTTPEPEPHGFHLVQRLGDAFVLTVFEEAPHELLARVLLGRVRGCARQDHLRLDVHEHHLDIEELGRDLEVELLHEDEVLVILPADVGEGQVPDVEFVLPDQVQQQVERPLELRQLHRVRPHEVRTGGDWDADAFSHEKPEEKRDFLEGKEGSSRLRRATELRAHSPFSENLPGGASQ